MVAEFDQLAILALVPGSGGSSYGAQLLCLVLQQLK